MAHAVQEKPGLLGLLRGPLARGSREGALLVISATAIYLLVSIASYHPGDPGWSNAGGADRIANQGGVAGAWLADVLLYLFGFMAYLFPVMIGYAGWLAYRGLKAAPGEFDASHFATRAAGCVVTICAGCGLATLYYHGPAAFPVDAGGIIGSFVGSGLAGVVNPLGGTLFLLALFLTGVTLFTGLSWLQVMDETGRFTIALAARLHGLTLRAWERWQARRLKRVRETQVRAERERRPSRKPPRIEPAPARIEPGRRAVREKQVQLFEPAAGAGALPPLALLDGPRERRRATSKESLEAMSRQVELKLADFGVEAEVVAVHPGPVVTRYELQPAPGLKVSRVTNLAKDLARIALHRERTHRGGHPRQDHHRAGDSQRRTRDRRAERRAQVQPVRRRRLPSRAGAGEGHLGTAGGRGSGEDAPPAGGGGPPARASPSPSTR